MKLVAGKSEWPRRSSGVFPIDLIDLQRDIGFAPHIRDPRMDCNSPARRNDKRL
jgi:hypothetical protein